MALMKVTRNSSMESLAVDASLSSFVISGFEVVSAVPFVFASFFIAAGVSPGKSKQKKKRSCSRWIQWYVVLVGKSFIIQYVY